VIMDNAEKNLQRIKADDADLRVSYELTLESVAKALEFRDPETENHSRRVVDLSVALAKELGLKLSPEHERQFGEILGTTFGDNQFENIVKFMSGRAPSETPLGEINKPGSEKCIALVYEGVDAVRKIRDVLGPTDPSKAPPGSIRREFGQTIMVNAAHASDSAENAQREIGIVKVGENTFRQLVEQYYGKV